jgi:beta-glucanase (GH16 family)
LKNIEHPTTCPERSLAESNGSNIQHRTTLETEPFDVRCSSVVPKVLSRASHLALTCAAVLWFAATPPPALAQPPEGYVLKWADEFDGTQLDPSKWKQWRPGKRRDATNVPEAVSVRDGFLTITTYTEDGKHFTGMIGTAGLFETRYGYWEARMKFDDAPGTWSCFWSESPTMGNPVGDVATAGLEIDFVEHRQMDNDGKDIANTANFTLHWDGYGKDHKVKWHATEDLKLGNGFHTYGCEWTETEYRFYIDGKVRWTADGPISKRPQFVILSTEVDDKSWASHIPKEGYGDRDTSEVKLVVDYVRYYAKP